MSNNPTTCEAILSWLQSWARKIFFLNLRLSVYFASGGLQALLSRDGKGERRRGRKKEQGEGERHWVRETKARG